MTKPMNTGYRIYKVKDVIGRVVPEDSAFWDIRVPPVVETWLWLDVGRSESQPERISPNIDVFLLWLSPTEERERPLPDHSSSRGKAASSSNNALEMHFLEPVQRGLAYILPLRWCLVNGEPFPGEDDIACLHFCLQLHHRERLLSVGFSGTAHSVTALGRFKTMDAVSEPQTLAPNTLYHCAACLNVLVSVLLPNVLLLSSWLSSLG